MPKRYADSVANDLRKFDQLKRVVKAQAFELNYAYLAIDAQADEIAELDSLNTDNVNYYEDYELPRHKKKIKLLGLAVGVETVLLLLLIL